MRNYFQVDSYIQQLEQANSISACDAVPIPDIADNQNYLFISYAHQDYKKVYADLAVLYQAGVRFWYDKGLSAGKNWDTEVKSVIENPRCCGVIFFISENSFLSKSVNQEIDLVIGEDNQVRKNYFCVNLTEEQPSRILRTILRMDDEVLDVAGLDMDRISTLARAFSDKQTYLPFSATEHSKQLLNQISMQFDVMNQQQEKHDYFILAEKNEKIQITDDTFFIGRDRRMCHYCIDSDSSVSKIHIRIDSEDSEARVIDMNAANGTYLNGQRIQPKEPVLLKDKDEIKIGQQILVYHVAE